MEVYEWQVQEGRLSETAVLRRRRRTEAEAAREEAMGRGLTEALENIRLANALEIWISTRPRVVFVDSQQHPPRESDSYVDLQPLHYLVTCLRACKHKHDGKQAQLEASEASGS